MERESLELVNLCLAAFSRELKKLLCIVLVRLLDCDI